VIVASEHGFNFTPQGWIVGAFLGEKQLACRRILQARGMEQFRDLMPPLRLHCRPFR
jgi:hypothetical protein